MKKLKATRLNIYLPSPAFRSQVKTAAAKRDISISEYCLRAITSQLIQDGEHPPRRLARHALSAAVDAARRFQTKTFGDRVFAMDSSELIREARKARAAG
jgi:hypothetical protein